MVLLRVPHLQRSPCVVVERRGNRLHVVLHRTLNVSFFALCGNVVKWFGPNKKTMLWILLNLLHVVVFWGTVGAVRWMYYPNKPMDMHCVRQVLLNQALHAPFVPLALSEAPWTGWHVLWQLPAIYALSDVIFFALHRLAHTKWLYRHVHRVHHEFDSPIPESSLYAHPLEHLLVNAVTVGVPLRLVCAHPVLVGAWIAGATVNVVVTHATHTGNHRHVVHHRKRTVNYGITTYWMDTVFGTLE